jgi:voltage-gated potassium channel
VIAPNNVDYLRDHWITAVSLLLPALRVLRIFRAFRLLRAARGVRSVTMVRLVTTLNRGMRAIRGSLGRRGIGYVVALTLIITFAGAAGIYYFEGPPGLALDPANANAGVGVDSYGQALWFTTMLMTTIGSDYWPVTTAGRVLTLLMSLYALGVFGYIAGAIASYFVQSGGIQSPLGGDGEASGPPELSEEMDSLRRQIALLNARLESAEAA